MSRFSGEAEAFAVEAKAKAEAEQMAKKADAWKEYKEAAIVDMMLQVRMPNFLKLESCDPCHENSQLCKNKQIITGL